MTKFIPPLRRRGSMISSPAREAKPVSTVGSSKIVSSTPAVSKSIPHGLDSTAGVDEVQMTTILTEQIIREKGMPPSANLGWFALLDWASQGQDPTVSEINLALDIYLSRGSSTLDLPDNNDYTCIQRLP